MYRWLGIASMIVTPLAAAVMLGSEVHAYLTPRVTPALALVGALGFAAAVELFGVLAGHLGVRAMRRKAWPAVVLASVALVAYGVAGWTSLDEYGWIFLLAALVYVMVAASELMERDEQVEQAQAADERQNRRNVAAEKRRLAHELALRELELAHAAHPVAQATQSVVEDSHDTTYYECTCGKVFNKPQAYSAHTRWCDVYEPSANGHVS